MNRVFVNVTFEMCAVVCFFKDFDAKSSKLCFQIHSTKLCEVLLLLNCPLTYGH